MKNKTKVLVGFILTLSIIIISVSVYLGVYLKNNERKVWLYDGSYLATGIAEKVGPNDTKIWRFTNIPYATAKFLEYPKQCTSSDNCKLPRPGVNLKCTQRTEFGMPTVTGKPGTDCLVLSILTPNVTASRPVLVWVHGGGLVDGDNSQVAPKGDFAADVDSVVVNINYRLDLPGFLAIPELRDSDIGTYGNYGHEDQITALKWVRDNIAKFGGDPERVTTLGESAGATSLLALLASSRTENLFRNIIALSPATTWSTISEASRNTVNTAIRDKCNGENVSSCLRKMTPEELINSNPTPGRGIGYFLFPKMYNDSFSSLQLSVIDGKIIKDDPKNYNKMGLRTDNPIRVFLSNTAQETDLSAYQINISNYTAMDTYLLTNLNAFKAATGDTHFKDVNAMKEEILEMYKINRSLNVSKVRKQYHTIASDVRSTCPTNYLAEELDKSDNLKVYRVYFEYTTDKTFFHAEDIFIGFEKPSSKIAIHFRDMVKTVVHGKVGHQWNTFPSTSLVISEESSKPVDGVPQKEECKFWKNKNGMDHMYAWEN